MRHLLVLLFSVCLLTVVSCSVDVPRDVISPGRMERILYDYHQAVAMAETSEQDVERERYVLVHKVFEKYGITEAEFDSSMVWYSGHAEYLTDIYKNIGNRMQVESARMGLDVAEDVYANLTETGDTAVVWRMTNLWLQNKPGHNLLKYTIQPDTSFHKRDTYMLRFRNLFVTQDSRREGYAMVVARYDNDSTASAVSRIGGNYEASIQIRQSFLTDEHELRSLTLYFYYDYEDDYKDVFRLWMVSSPTLIRFHHPEVVEEKEIIDSLLTDEPDTLIVDDPRPKTERLTPVQMRSSHEGEHTINVQKQRRVILPANHRKQKPARQQ